MFHQTKNYYAFRQSMALSTRPENLESYSDKEYDYFRVYSNWDCTIGFAITPGLELVNLFNNTGIRGAGSNAIRTAIELGATRLNCFDGPLVKYYEIFGFIEFARAKFSIAYAPPGWHNSMGRPDIIFMEILK